MIILDASFIIAYKIENDVHHKKVVDIMTKITNGDYGNPIISDYIFDEIVNVILQKLGLSSTKEIGELLINSVDIYHVGKLFEESWKIFKNQKNTNLSFTDCSILALMTKEKINYIATFDEGFSKLDDVKVIEN